MELALRDVARLFGVSTKTISQWVRQEGMPAHLVNEQYRFSRSELLEWATARGQDVAADLFVEPHAAEIAPGLDAALEAGGVHAGLPANDRDSALRALVARMPLLDEMDRELLLGVLLAREALQPTAVGDGIAIPHVRNPIVLRVKQPMIMLAFLENAVDFGALDGKGVHTLFAVVSPTVRAHLHLLSRLAFALRDPGFRDAVLRRADASEIFREARRLESELARRQTPALGSTPP